ncbi:MAG: FecR domain-containing protein [Lachnospiraceae bacterium]|nr:FecR domain-containing protein [Lachnospiraceae bacterium]
MKNKKIVIVLILLVCMLAACIAVIAVVLGGKKEEYRLIKIYEYDGDGVVNRKSLGDMEPYNNMILESGDNVRLNQGLMNLKLDDDKYVYVEENTEFTIEAIGTEENSKTTINLKSGAITNDIQNKLSEESTYEINTPNVTISVRGTNYRVGIYEDDKGVKYSRVSVFEGKVTTKLVMADGTVADEELEVDAGKEITIIQDDSATDYLGEPTDIDYSTLPESVGGTMSETSGGSATDNDANVAGDTSEEKAEADLTQEEIDGLTIFAKYVSSTQSQSAEAVEGMTIQMSDEVVMKFIGTLANDSFGETDTVFSLKLYAIANSDSGGVLSVTKDEIDQYVSNVFDYNDIANYEIGNVMAGSNGYEIWAHQGSCDTTITINETYMEGENYVIKGVANLNYSDIFDPMFMDAEFTFTVRRNPDSPFGFTYVDFVFGAVTKY